jgi:FMN phosphatase YigB (HAD superfamily)
MKNRITLFIFDMGGVVSRNNDFLTPIAEHFGLKVPELYKLAGKDWLLMMEGKLSPDVFWKRIGEKTGMAVEGDLFTRFFHPSADRKVLRIVSWLKSRARVVVGTNTIVSHYEVHRRLGDYDHFDAVYASFQMGVAKPDPEFYLAILKQEGKMPSEIVFIDDMEENVESASALGIFSILFTEAAELKRQLSPFAG